MQQRLPGHVAGMEGRTKAGVGHQSTRYNLKVPRPVVVLRVACSSGVRRAETDTDSCACIRIFARAHT